jgi:hypothetical protein
MKTLKQIIMRIFAVIAAESLGVIGAGSLVGIEVWQAATLAGALGAARVLEALARFYLADGNLTAEEINAAFSKVDKNSDKEDVAPAAPALTVPDAPDYN